MKYLIIGIVLLCSCNSKTEFSKRQNTKCETVFDFGTYGTVYKFQVDSTWYLMARCGDAVSIIKHSK